MNICFNAVFEKTFLYHEIAKRLQLHGHKVFWIIVNDAHYDFLRQHYSVECLIYLNKKDYSNEDAQKVGDYAINSMIYSDRVMRHEKYEEAKKFLISIQQPMLEFIKENKIDFVIGEKNMAYQQLISKIVSSNKQLSCKHLHAASIRIPPGHFAFFEDDSMSIFYDSISHSTDSGNKSALTSHGTLALDKPDYVEKVIANIKNKRMSMKDITRRVAKYIFSYPKYDPTFMSSRVLRLLLAFKRKINKLTYNYFVSKISYEDLLGYNRKYVLVTLHVQPEASIDVIGKFYDDQATNIVNIWRVLPCDWLLVIKEHKTAVGDRGYKYFKDLQKSRDQILVVKESEDSHKLIANSELVVTVSGTAAYEAVLMDKPALTFAETFFNKSSLCNKVSIDDFRKCETIKDLIPTYKNDKEEFGRWVLGNIFKGDMLAPSYSPECMSEDNISLLTDAFLALAATKAEVESG